MSRLVKDAIFTWSLMALGFYFVAVAIEHRFITPHQAWVLLRHFVLGVQACLR